MQMPRSWLASGLIVAPCLSERGMKGGFELEFYCSEAIHVRQLPDGFSRTVAGDWVDGMSGGSHINPNWKKNPKVSMHSIAFYYAVLCCVAWCFALANFLL